MRDEYHEGHIYFMRHRTYAASLGRFIQRDPIGIWTDEINLGNGFTFVGNNPVNTIDPLGTHVQDSPGGLSSQAERALKEAERQLDRARDRVREKERERDERKKKVKEFADSLPPPDPFKEEMTPEDWERISEMMEMCIDVLDAEKAYMDALQQWWEAYAEYDRAKMDPEKYAEEKRKQEEERERLRREWEQWERDFWKREREKARERGIPACVQPGEC